MIKHGMSSILAAICSVFTVVFGKMNWNSPPWMLFLRDKAKRSPFLFGGIATLAVLSFTALLIVWSWYQHLPKPIYTTASITTPAITPNEESLIPSPLVINFGVNDKGFNPKSVAPINLIGKSVPEGIALRPALKGQWFWNSDSQLSFTPEEDWPANQTFSIRLAKTSVAANANLEKYDYSFVTQAFQASISEFKFYQNPVHPEKKMAVATLQFNYPVDPARLEKNTSLQFEEVKKGQRDPNAQTLGFTYSYDKNKRIAYLHSDEIQITDLERFLRLTLGKEVSSSTMSGTLKEPMTSTLLIPNSSTMLRVLSASASVVRNDKNRPEQVLSIETSLGVTDSDFNQFVHVYLLPQDYPATSIEKAKPNHAWQNPGEVTSSILALSKPLVKQAIPAEHHYSSLHSFKFTAPTPQYLYVKIDKGMKGLGGFVLNHDYTTVVPVQALPQEISFLHQGSLLALGGEKKLSVLVRGLPAVKFEFARILPSNVNQLVTQTQGDFNNPYFINPSFNQTNISQIFTDVQSFDASNLTKEQYTALDLGKYLAEKTNPTGPQGLFLVQATGWDIATNSALNVKSSRLILMTDLGLLVKDNKDGSHDVFVQSISKGLPVANVTVSVLGKNGLSVLSQITNNEGRAHFPSLKDFIDDRAPTAYLASLNQDVSFIPFDNATRALNFSKFDVGGLYTNTQELNSLRAYLFSDRGIYRPGDTVHLGMIVKQAFAKAQAAGLPLQVRVTDSRGTVIKDQQFSLNDTGFMALDVTTQPTSPTGQYFVNLYLVKDNYPQNLLGSTILKVAEFQPDRLRITSSLLPKPSEGWSAPKGLKASVNLWNLYGAPATNRRVSAKILLVPQQVQWSQFPDYVFADPLVDSKKPARVFTEDLSDSKTNEKGEAEFDLNLERFDKATYQLTFFAEGFEAEGGRSVTSQSQVLVSPLPYFVGYKPEGDLNFIRQNTPRKIHFIAVNPQLAKRAVGELQLQLVSLHPVTTLVKKADGTFQYQSIIQSKVISTNPFTINEQGSNFALPTQQIGDYSLAILDKDNTVLSQLKYSVVGASQLPLAKNAELSLKLDKSQYKPGEDITLQITAPYTGSGLITIERDKVYATQWFKSETTNSVQTIRLPADFEGNGYVNVAFIRDWASPEFFISPLSYSVVPFTVNHDNHVVRIDLSTPKVVRPGDTLTIDYKTDKPSKIVVFAVDEGILQVARFDTPDPLAFFFEKQALEVLTQQTVDQILPKFIQDRELSAVGGDGGEDALASHLNPFKRKTDLPVVFWSGLMDADDNTRKVTYPIPDYFNGKIRVMAVAVAADSVGSTHDAFEVRGDFVINPNVPTFVAPGDEFEISASVANNVKESEKNAAVTIELSLSPNLELLGDATQRLAISEGQEQAVRYRLRAKSLLGASQVEFKASSGEKATTMAATLSVRPASPLLTSIETGMSKKATQTLDIMQTFYPQHRSVEASLSTNPLIFVFGLERYLTNFPYGCTEQLTSKAMPMLAMASQSGFNKDREVITQKVDETIQMLAQRQTSTGGFSYWPGLGDNPSNDFSTVYAMHFLTEAREQGFNVPSELFSNGLGALRDLAGRKVSDAAFARIQAYAIYILTRNEIVTTNYLANLQLVLQQDVSNAWQKELTGVYIAASYQLLKSFDEANRLISQYQPQSKPAFVTDFYDGPIADAQYLAILAKHFPKRLDQVGEKLIMSLVQAMNNDEINTVLSGYTSLALSAYQPNASNSSLSMTQALMNNQEEQTPSQNTNFQKMSLNPAAKKISFNNPEQQVFFYQLIQEGFDKAPATKPVSQGIEIFREYRDAKNQVVTSTSLGSELEVHIQIRALGNKYLTNIAIEDLLPGGFEVVSDSIKASSMDYADVREDRVNFFGSIDSTAKEIVYKIKATNAGKYMVPPIYAQAMYNPAVKARGVGSEMGVAP